MSLAYWIPLFPLLGFLINGLCRKKISKTVAGLIGVSTLLCAFVVSVYIFIDVKQHGGSGIIFFDFINIKNFTLPFAFQIDQLTTIFLLIITGIGSLIHIYSTSYMHEESASDFAKYFAYLNLFIFFMLLLVMGANYVVMFIGWEGVGLCSYLLIGYWFKNKNYTKAANKAFIMNRIGDLGFLLAIFWIISKLGTANYTDVFTHVSKLSSFDITMITLFLFVGATGKSAQIPLYTWLPDAMAGPTPVSALIHAATMVTAGIYMIVRNNALFSLAPTTQTIIAVIGLSTAILAATIATKQNDIKKVLAYSTVSQLGYMFLALGVGAYTGAVFHVMTHAFFKALLFLGAGSVIHALHGQQDIRLMGGLKKYMPITHITFLLACLAIAGIPPFSGFFSKDEILANVYEHSPVMYGIALLGALLTAFYMFRLYTLTFLGSSRDVATMQQAHESPRAITIPLILLAILSVVGGFLGIPALFAPNAHALQQFLAPVLGSQHQQIQTLSHTTEWVLMISSVILVIMVVVITIRHYKKYVHTQAKTTAITKLLENKWYIDELYNAIIVKPIYAIGHFLKNTIERYIIDGFVNGVGSFLQYSSRKMRLLQSGQIASYILLMVISMIGLFLFLFFRFK